jgi:hypothetical protein
MVLFLLTSSIWWAFSTAIKFRRQPGSEILIGVRCSLFAMSIHGLYDWMLVVYPNQYLFAILIGIVAGLRAYLYKCLTVSDGPLPCDARSSLVSAATF